MKTALAFYLSSFALCAWAQEIKTFSIKSYNNQEAISVQANCSNEGLANVIFFSKIKDIRFEGEINEQKYIPERQKYILCIRANVEISIRIAHADFAPTTKLIRLEPGGVSYFIINPDESHHAKEKTVLNEEKQTVDLLQKHRNEILRIKRDLQKHSKEFKYGPFKSDSTGHYAGANDTLGIRNGKGIYITNDGSIYEGNFINGKFQQGYALENSYSGEYIGEYNNFRKEGQGSLTTSNGSKYEGYFSEGNFRNGKAIEVISNTKYEGEYNGFIREGQGTLTLTNGSRYVGYFNNGTFQRGEGTEVFSNGSYIGEFNNSARDGKGILTKGCFTYKGIFRGGNFMSGVALELDDGIIKSFSKYENFKKTNK